MVIGYPLAVIAVVIDRRFKAIKAVLLKDQTQVMVHAPDHVANAFLKGVRVVIEPLKNPGKVCSYRVLSRELDGQWVGANPSFSEEVAYAYLSEVSTPLKLIRKQHTISALGLKTRVDATCQIDGLEKSVEIKGVNVIKDGVMYFPYASAEKALTYRKPVSARAIRQGRILLTLGGHILYVCIGPLPRLPLCQNPADVTFHELYSQLPAWELYAHWSKFNELTILGLSKRRVKGSSGCQMN